MCVSATDRIRLRLRAGPQRNGPLAVAVLVAALGVAVAVVGATVDSRTITGAPAWLKPLKFALSITFYCATVQWMLRYVQDRPRLTRICAWLTTVALLGELFLVDLQAYRGTTSHFNISTRFDASVLAVMAALVVIVFGTAVVLAFVLLRQPHLPGWFAAGLQGGLFVCLLGMLEAVLMIAHHGHTVGAPDGSPGLLLIGWSSQHGDLRIAHFTGLHALQVLPTAAWLIQRRLGPNRLRRATRLVRLLSITYAGTVILLAWQAERGESLQHPSETVTWVALTWTAAALSVALCTSFPIRPAARRPPPTRGRVETLR